MCLKFVILAYVHRIRKRQLTTPKILNYEDLVNNLDYSNKEPKREMEKNKFTRWRTFSSAYDLLWCLVICSRWRLERVSTISSASYNSLWFPFHIDWQIILLITHQTFYPNFFNKYIFYQMCHDISWHYSFIFLFSSFHL